MRHLSHVFQHGELVYAEAFEGNPFIAKLSSTAALKQLDAHHSRLIIS